MDVQSLVRPMAQLLSSPARRQCAKSITPLFAKSSIRTHKTTARTKRALKIAPHDSFQPDRRLRGIAPTDTIIYNPPSSEASPYHTPFIFLPRNDPRRTALLRLGPGARAIAPRPAPEDLPPETQRYPRSPRGHITAAGIAEMKRLRAEDPLQWSTGRLAKKFNCSPVFVSIAAPAPAEHLKWLKEKREKKTERWGPIRQQAREDRKKRAEMMYRGEI